VRFTLCKPDRLSLPRPLLSLLPFSRRNIWTAPEARLTSWLPHWFWSLQTVFMGNAVDSCEFCGPDAVLGVRKP
jgi:hypothetical protein